LKAEGIIPDNVPDSISSQPTITRQKRSYSLIEEEGDLDLDHFLEEKTRKNRVSPFLRRSNGGRRELTQ